MQLLNIWLERMPFFNEAELWVTFTTTFPNSAEQMAEQPGLLLAPFWKEYRFCLFNSLAEVESANLQAFDKVVIGQTDSEAKAETSLSPAACRAALFIMLYRGYPMLQLPFQLINAVLETDELLSSWRYRHMNMVHRMIGHRIGTGGSTGQHYKCRERH